MLWCRYVQGDFRFRTGYCKTNPRKMVKLWAEKEFRNLSRLKAAGIRCPQPVHLRMHVLVMEFVGSDGVAAPRLKVSLFQPPAAACCHCLTLRVPECSEACQLAAARFLARRLGVPHAVVSKVAK